MRCSLRFGPHFPAQSHLALLPTLSARISGAAAYFNVEQPSKSAVQRLPELRPSDPLVEKRDGASGGIQGGLDYA